MESTDNNGLFRKTKKGIPAGGFYFLKDSIENRNGFIKYWDTVARAPYLFNPDTRIFITYDDERSIK